MKGLVGFSGALGTSFAILSPLSSGFDYVQSAPSQATNPPESDSCEATEADVLQESLVGKNFNFDALWREVKRRLNKVDLCKTLIWKMTLRQILVQDNNQPQWWIKSENWKECFSSSSCGYLELEEIKVGKPRSYKLLMGYDKNEWKVWIVRVFNNGDPSFYNGFPKNVDVPVWETVNGVKWDDFDIPNTAGNGSGWTKISGFSIQQSF